jgi:hypothetical protein
LLPPAAAAPQLRRMTVRNERGEDVSWLFGVPPELRGGPAAPAAGAQIANSRNELAAARLDPRPFTVRRRVRLVDELGAPLLVDEHQDQD